VNEVDAGRDRVSHRSRLRCGLFCACAAYAPGSSHAIMVSHPQTRSRQMCPPRYLPLRGREGRREGRREGGRESALQHTRQGRVREDVGGGGKGSG